MKKVVIFIFAVAALIASGCGAVHTIEDDAKNTPIGSVVTGETDNADSYIKRVSERNRSLDKDTWRPESRDRF